MRYGAFLVLAFGATSALLAQTTAYQDADGQSSLYLMNSSAVLTYNVSASKFTIGYLHEPNVTMDQSLSDLKRLRVDDEIKLNQLKSPSSDAPQADKDAYEKQKLFYSLEIQALDGKIQQVKDTAPKHLKNPEFGLSFSGKPSADLGGQIFQTSNSPASISGGGSVGVHGLKAEPPALVGADNNIGKPPLFQDDSFLVYFDFTRSTFDTVPTSSSTVTTQHFDGFDILPTYNAFLSHKGWDYLIGISGGVNRTNNSGDLKKVVVNTTDAQSGTVSIVSQESAYMGAYKVSTGVPIYSDLAIIPAKLEWLSFDIFERANAVSTNGYGEGGVGVFVAKPKKPTNVLGGVSAAWKNGKSTIAVVAGWTF
jgi:hypothetical protein